MSKRILIIDGNSLTYRAYYATAYDETKILRTSIGFPTNAIVTFYNMIHSAIGKLKPNYVFVAFDAGKQTFRHESFDDYKGTRKETPHDLILQFPVIRELLEKLSISWYEKEGYEADDIIASCTNKFKDEFDEILVMTSDRDLLQLVNEKVSVIFNKQGVKVIEEITSENFFKKFGYNPNQAIDYKALVGDSSDNISGVLGIGPKTAITLLTKYENLEKIYANLSEQNSSIRHKLEVAIEKVNLWKKLIELDKTVELDCTIDEFILSGKYQPDLKRFLKQYELNSIIKKIFSEDSNDNMEKLELINKKIFEKDIEKTTNLAFVSLLLNSENYHIAKSLGIGVFLNNEYSFYSNFKDKNLIEILISKSIKKIVFNSKEIEYFYWSKGFEIQNAVDDIQLLHYVINPSVEDSLEQVCLNFDIDPISRFDFLTKTYIKKVKDDNISLLLEFETKAMALLYWDCSTKLVNLGLSDIYKEIERPYTKVLLAMEKHGVKIDTTFLTSFKGEIEIKRNRALRALNELTKEKVNFNSPKQINDYINNELKIFNIDQNTSISSLEKLQNKHEIFPLLIEYRKWEKLYTTYIEGIFKYIDNDCIRTVFHQTRVETGRLSSSFPNIQNIAIRNDDQREVRKAFVAREGHSFLFADYSQIELRIFADFANINEFIEIFNHDGDIHTITAAEVFGISPNNVTPRQRRIAKMVNFGIIYGLTFFGLSKQLKVSISEAKNLIENYNKRYPEIEKYRQTRIIEGFEKKIIRTLMGRLRIIPNSLSPQEREFYKRVIINMPIQGTVADIIKMASNKIYDLLENNEGFFISQVHDELVFEIRDKCLDKYQKIIKEIMESVVSLKVNLPVNIKISKSWFFE